MSRAFFRRVAVVMTMATFMRLATNASHAAQLAVSDFSADSEGWTVLGDVTSAVPTYAATGGNPGGYINTTDSTVGGVWFWSAPAEFLGNKSGAYGFPLTYELRMRGDGPLFDNSDVILNGGGLSLHLDHTPPVPEDVAWTSYSALLSELGGWRVGSVSGPVATQADVQTVLANLTGLQIRGEFITGSDNGDLDNVVVNGVPEPTSWLLMLTGSGTIFWRRCLKLRIRIGSPEDDSAA